MTQFPSPEPEPSSPEPQRPLPSRRQRLLRRSIYVISGIALVGGVSVAGAGIWFVRNRLAPLVETSLTNIINRPVNVGPVEGFSLTHIQFGESRVPPTPTDEDGAWVETVVARFNLLEFLANRTLTLDIDMVRPEVFIDQTEDGAWLDLDITTDPDAPQIIKLDTLRVRQGQVVLQPFPWASIDADAPPASDPPPQVVVGNVNGQMTLREENRLIGFEVTAEPESGGTLAFRGQANLDQDALNFVARSNRLFAPDLARLIRMPLTIEDGLLNTNVVVNLDFNNLEQVRMNGTASFRDLVAEIPNVPERITEGAAQLRFRDRQIRIEEGEARYGQIQALSEGTIHLDDGFDLAIRLPSISIAQAEQTFNVTAPVPASGRFETEIEVTGPLQSPQVGGSVRNLDTVIVDRVALATLATRFAATAERVTFTEMQAVPVEGGLVTGQGNIQLGETGGLVFDLIAQGLPVDNLLTRYEATLPADTVIGPVSGNLQVFGPLGDVNAIQAIANWSAPQGTYPSQGQIRYANQIVQVRDGRVQVAGGTVTGQADASLVDRSWRSRLQASDIPLRPFSEYLQGILSASVEVVGTLDDFSPAALRATGTANFSEGIYLLDRPLNTEFSWLGDRVQIHQATAPGFAADGIVQVALGQPNPIGALDLNVLLQNFDLQPLQPFLPAAAQAQVAFAGQADFDGRVTGTGVMPQVMGALALRDFTVNQFAFEPVMTGDVAFALGQGVVVDVAGQQDRIAAQLDYRYLPTAFFIQHGEAIAQARTVDNRLVGTIENLELARLAYAPAADQGLGEIRGRLSSNFTANIQDLRNPTVLANVAIANPGIGYINLEQFSGELRYQDGVGVLREGELLFGISRYWVSGVYNPQRSTPLTAEVVAAPGDVQDLLVALQFFEIEDFARGLRAPTFATAEAVVPTEVNMLQESLLNQIRRLSEILALQEQQRQAQEEAILPPLAEADGQFQGVVNLAFAPTTGLTANFNLSGEDWRWGPHRVDTVTAIGEFQDGVLAFLPLRLTIDDGFINMAGQIGGDQQSAQVIAEDIPVALIRDFVNLPLDIDGTLNANALLSGSIQNPQAVGSMNLTQGTLRETPIQSAELRFNYNNARLNFVGDMTLAEIQRNGFVVESPEPLRMRGSIPYAFQFMTVEPASDALEVSISVQDDGIALMNLFTDQVAWEGGKGLVELDITGTMSEPIADGIIALVDTTLTSPRLPEPLTNVNGSVVFTRDRLVVRSLTGEYGEGEVVAGGFLSISRPVLTPIEPAREEEAAVEPDSAFPDDPSTFPLTVMLRDLEIEYEDLFAGVVNGRMVFTGSVLGALIGGEVTVSNGSLQLVQPEPPDTAVQPFARTMPLFVPPQLNNLDVVLGRSFRIERNQPDINFLASGKITMNGPFDSLQADGTVQLERGYVNVVVTQFNLARRTEEFPQTAVFRPGDGLDPFLNVRLTATVPEVVRPPIITTSSPFAGAEVIDPVISASNYGALQTVRIQATVQGPASRLFEELVLTSEPGRSESEILALIGGGALGALEQGDGTLALANLASAALLSDIQNLIANVFGLSDFRLFPTEVISERNQASTLGLAAEVGFNITDNLSASIIQVLTADDLTQFGLRYRINDEFSVRGSTTLEGDSRVILEYRSRF
jgi:translocation and assembly module TamB